MMQPGWLGLARPMTEGAALPMSPLAFRLRSGGDDPAWLSDEMGGGFEPGDPDMSRRDFLVRVVVVVTAVTIGGAINALAMAAAHAAR